MSCHCHDVIRVSRWLCKGSEVVGSLQCPEVFTDVVTQTSNQTWKMSSTCLDSVMAITNVQMSCVQVSLLVSSGSCPLQCHCQSLSYMTRGLFWPPMSKSYEHALAAWNLNIPKFEIDLHAGSEPSQLIISFFWYLKFDFYPDLDPIGFICLYLSFPSFFTA